MLHAHKWIKQKKKEKKNYATKHTLYIQLYNARLPGSLTIVTDSAEKVREKKMHFMYTEKTRQCKLYFFSARTCATASYGAFL